MQGKVEKAAQHKYEYNSNINQFFLYDLITCRSFQLKCFTVLVFEECDNFLSYARQNKKLEQLDQSGKFRKLHNFIVMQPFILGKDNTNAISQYYTDILSI